MTQQELIAAAVKLQENQLKKWLEIVEEGMARNPLILALNKKGKPRK